MEIDLLHHELQSYYLLTLPEFVTKTFSSEIDCITHGVRLTNILLDWFMLFYKNSIISFLFSLEETVSQQKKNVFSIYQSCTVHSAAQYMCYNMVQFYGTWYPGTCYTNDENFYSSHSQSSDLSQTGAKIFWIEK